MTVSVEDVKVSVLPDDSIEEQPVCATVPLQPFGKWVVCRMRKRGKTASGLLMVETAFGSARLAPWRVVAVGPEVTRVKVDDAVTVVNAKYHKFDYGGESWCFVKEKHIHSVLTDDRLQSDENIHTDELAGRKFSAGGKYVE